MKRSKLFWRSLLMSLAVILPFYLVVAAYGFSQAGLRLTASELIRLEEQGTEPVPALLGEDGRQNLTERIYDQDTIFDGVLESKMEGSPARDALLASLLRLLRAGSLFLV